MTNFDQVIRLVERAYERRTRKIAVPIHPAFRDALKVNGLIQVSPDEENKK